MVFGLPTPGEPNWDVKLDASIEAVKTTADEAAAEIAGRLSESSLTASYEGHLVATAGDQAARINDYLAASSPALGINNRKRLVGSFAIDSTVTVPAGVILDMGDAIVTASFSDTNAFTVGEGAAVKGGEIISPEAWDGANVAWTYAVIYVSGNNATVEDVTLTNVKKVGIAFDDVDGGIARGNRIRGNYPSASWTGTETGHFGITVDASGSATDGNFVLADNIIETCVQGLFIGNYGPTATGRGIAVTGNVFTDCYNHGVYATNGTGYVVDGNAFSHCQYPVALTGSYHVVSNNTMVTVTSGGERDYQGISMRNPIGCVVTGNTIKGEIPSGNIVINLTDISGGTVVRDNIVAHNVIEVTGAGSTAIGVNSAATTCENNIVTGNRIRCGAKSGTGVISVVGVSDSPGKGNQVFDNDIVVTSDGHGVYASYQQGFKAQRNTVRWEFDAASAITLAGALLSNVTTSMVTENDFVIEAAWGTNITIRGVWETGTCTTNRVLFNRYRFDATKTAARIEMVLGSTSGTVIDESGAGAPNVNAGIGSIWRRTDGASGTVIYVKETGTGATGWARATPIRASATLDFPSVAAAGTQDLTVTATGALVNDTVHLGPPTGLTAGLIPFAWVSATDTVTIRLTNITAGAIDPASATWKVAVHQGI